ncbi:MAG: mycothione reductase [Acidimicrobiia bacterium]
MRDYDLIVIGAGSGNSIFTPELADWRCAVIEEDRFGGTCLNRGCVPSKMLVAAADVAHAVRTAGRLDVRAEYEGVDWPALRDRVFRRIDPAHEDAVDYRVRNGIDVFSARARFVEPRVLEVDGERLTARHIVVAVGSRPMIPDVDGLADVAFHTSDTIMRIDALPRSMVVLGGGFIAAEMGHVFSALGTDVTVLQRSARLLMSEDDDVSARFTEIARERMRVETDVRVEQVRHRGDDLVVTARRAGETFEVVADTVLVATGRTPNTDRLDAVAGGLELDADGRVVVDRHFRTNVEGVWAFGDVANEFQLKHMANAEARIVAHNLAHPDHPAGLRSLEHEHAPHAVFAGPQVAAFGLTEREARALGRPIRVATRPYSDTAYGWALEDTTSFVKVVADATDRTLLGAHIIGPHASILIQPLVQAMTFGQTVDDVAQRVIYIHPALSEAVEQALLAVVD